MSFKGRYTPLLLLGTLAFIPAACSTDDCEGNKNSLPYAEFYTSAISPKQITVDSLTVYGQGAPGDSLLTNNASLSSVYLPFDIDSEETTYFFKYNRKELAEHNITDRITFRYNIRPMFVSSACGVIYQYEVKNIEYTTHLIDSVTCPGGVITNADSPNIRVYFRVSQD